MLAKISELRYSRPNFFVLAGLTFFSGFKISGEPLDGIIWVLLAFITVASVAVKYADDFLDRNNEVCSGKKAPYKYPDLVFFALSVLWLATVSLFIVICVMQMGYVWPSVVLLALALAYQFLRRYTLVGVVMAGSAHAIVALYTFPRTLDPYLLILASIVFEVIVARETILDIEDYHEDLQCRTKITIPVVSGVANAQMIVMLIIGCAIATMANLELTSVAMTAVAIVCLIAALFAVRSQHRFNTLISRWALEVGLAVFLVGILIR